MPSATTARNLVLRITENQFAHGGPLKIVHIRSRQPVTPQQLELIPRTHEFPALIVNRPRIMGGSPIIAGTRIRVMDIIRHYRLEGRTVTGVKRALPFLTTGQIQAALDYYRGHRGAIEAEIETEHALAAQWRQNDSI